MALILRDLLEEDIEWARQLHNDQYVLMMLTDPHIVTPEEQIKWFHKLQTSTTSARLMVENEGRRIGLIRLDSIDFYNKSICVGLDIHKDFRGKGFAKPIYRELFREIFQERDFNRIWLMVAEYNDIARKLYQELGFIEEGRQREALYKEGRFYDYILMGMLKGEQNAM
jgi:RimJ/RimL family protein N-acetyltransferase